MSSSKEIKRRIKSVKNTKKITKAMELVAASKMKRAVNQTLSSRIYSSFSWDILTSLSDRLENVIHRFFVENKNEKKLIVLITSNRGLCGGYNSQAIKKILGVIKNDIGHNIDIVTVGKKGEKAMKRIGQNIVATFTEVPDTISMRDIVPLSTYLMLSFEEEKYGSVYVVYTDFIGALTQKPVIRKLLPISKEELKETIEVNTRNRKQTEIPYLVEENTEKLLNTLAEKLIRMQIYQMMLESNASEQSSRMVAMKNANEAAGEMINDLTLVFNKARQSGITREISEISAGMASIN